MKLAAIRLKFEHWLQRQWQRRGIWAWSMTPFTLLFGLILKLRLMWYGRPHHRYAIPVPVLVVGNIYIGGTGKTPIVIALVNALKQRGWHPGVLSRGYGTHVGAIPLLGQGTLDAKCAGDEPALIAAETGVPIAVHPNRLQACKNLLERFPEVDLVISDDGLQHLKLERDLELVVQDTRGTGNGWLLPSGPLREPVSRLNSVHGILNRIDGSQSDSQNAEAGSIKKTAVTLQVCRFKHLVSGEILNIESFVAGARGITLAAVAGIARPERFFEDLRKFGLVLSETLALQDHFSFDPLPFSSLKSERILVTSKDAVKLGSLNEPRLWVAEAEISFSDPAFIPWLDCALRTHIKRSSSD